MEGGRQEERLKPSILFNVSFQLFLVLFFAFYFDILDVHIEL